MMFICGQLGQIPHQASLLYKIQPVFLTRLAIYIVSIEDCPSPAGLSTLLSPSPICWDVLGDDRDWCTFCNTASMRAMQTTILRDGQIKTWTIPRRDGRPWRKTLRYHYYGYCKFIINYPQCTAMKLNKNCPC